ncbi:putative peptidase M8 [Trypanosoma grayi]|uniref:putative peptidase M8 n=1 Tax=Trypanosoma grayi TaxID=71804 RepID=UPI0004F434FC|nr:putative peptidase M8 [Trypanosoma grayi]KEG07190.1 putative peptidase M8 [Trypanosoma grayi]
MLANNNAQRMRCLLGVTLLLLVHCAGSTLAVSEHHRCIYDYVSNKLPGVQTVTPIYSTPMQTALPLSTDQGAKTFRPPDSVMRNRFPLPSGDFKPLRVKVFVVATKGSRTCASASGEITTTLGTKVSCTEDDVLTAEKKKILVQTILPEAVKLHTERLYVRPTTFRVAAPNFSDTNACGELDIPEEHHTEGVDDVDMVLYATAAPTADGAFAWAATCAVHPNGRPLIGVINYSPRHIARTSQAVRVAAHEIAHTLGFNVKTMEKYKRTGAGISPKGLQGRKTPVFDAANTKIVTEYFYNCSNKNKMPLENEAPWMAAAEGEAMTPPVRVSPPGVQAASVAGIQAESADVLNSEVPDLEPVVEQRRITVIDMPPPPPLQVEVSSHWKRLVAKDELMTGLVGAGRYTLLTLAAFADLQFYMVDWTKAEPMNWGRNAGCDFLTNEKKCVESGVSKHPGMFCTGSTDEKKLRCTSDRQALGTCVTKEYENLPERYQYFETKGGKMRGGRREDMMDYCPIVVAGKGFSCIDGDRSVMPGSLVGANSRCVEGKNLTVLGNEVGDVCVHVACFYGSVYVQYAGAPTYYFCPEGRSLRAHGDFDGYGNITCPRYEDVCTTMLPEEETTTTSDVPSLSQFVSEMSNVLINMAVERYIADPMPAKQQENQAKGTKNVQVTDVTAAKPDVTNDIEQQLATATSDASESQAATKAPQGGSTVASGAGDSQTSTSTATNTPKNSEAPNNTAEGSQTTAESNRQKIVSAQGKNLDLKLNADGGAAASALMPLVLAVVGASAIMAH